MTVTDFIQVDVRRQLADSVTPFRWTDAVLTVYLNQAIRNIYNLHPESAYVTSVVIAGPADLTVDQLGNGSTQMPITDPFLSPAMHYVCHRCFGEDSEEAGDRVRASDHYQIYLREIA